MSDCISGFMQWITLQAQQSLRCNIPALYIGLLIAWCFGRDTCCLPTWQSINCPFHCTDTLGTDQTTTVSVKASGNQESCVQSYDVLVDLSVPEKSAKCPQCSAPFTLTRCNLCQSQANCWYACSVAPTHFPASVSSRCGQCHGTCYL